MLQLNTIHFNRSMSRHKTEYMIENAQPVEYWNELIIPRFHFNGSGSHRKIQHMIEKVK